MSKAAIPDTLFFLCQLKSTKSSVPKLIPAGDVGVQNKTLHMYLAKGLPFDLTCINTGQTCGHTK